MIIQNFKQLGKPPFVASFDVLFEKMGMIIRDCKLVQSNGKQWISMPSRPYEDNEGKKKYFSYIQFTENRKDAFDAKIKELLAMHIPKNAYDFQGEVPF